MSRVRWEINDKIQHWQKLKSLMLVVGSVKMIDPEHAHQIHQFCQIKQACETLSLISSTICGAGRNSQDAMTCHKWPTVVRLCSKACLVLRNFPGFPYPYLKALACHGSVEQCPGSKIIELFQ